ncbi:MAG: hypothetical protein PHV37_09325 [Candidatus Gastranaerophilales bacterium]|nr:hypothetical protein [Candidatus Gastranaerophilales bacterium]
MVSGINSGINSIRFFNATNAFKAAVAEEKPEKNEPMTADGVHLNDNNDMLKVVDVKDVKKYASLLGEDGLSDDDIKYGLTYGRSVIADWMV